jgi:hypothetical protein
MLEYWNDGTMGKDKRYGPTEIKETSSLQGIRAQSRQSHPLFLTEGIHELAWQRGGKPIRMGERSRPDDTSPTAFPFIIPLFQHSSIPESRIPSFQHSIVPE